MAFDYTKMTKSQIKSFIEGYNYHAATGKFKARGSSYAYFGESAAQRHILRIQVEQGKTIKLEQATVEDFPKIADMAKNDDEWFNQ